MLLRRLTRYIPWALSALCMCLMLLFSSQDGESSASLSGDIAAFIMRLFTGAEPEHASDAFALVHLIVRKLAHVSEYFVLALLLHWALLTLPRVFGYRYWILYAACITFSLADEWLQTGVSGRAGRFADVLIDMLGVLIAIAATYIWRRARNGAKEVRNEG